MLAKIHSFGENHSLVNNNRLSSYKGITFNPNIRTAKPNTKLRFAIRDPKLLELKNNECEDIEEDESINKPT
jgi:hypothetical protein